MLMDVRILSFDSETYPYGENDVVLRRNIGIWESEADVIVFQDDDQIAPANMLSSIEGRFLEGNPLIFGHHRYIDFREHSVDELLVSDPSIGREREKPPNSFHLFYSCYAGMFAAKRSLLLEIGGFDMMFLGRHGNEDQSLGRRLMTRFGMQRVFIHEPPFAWHPTEPNHTWARRRNNLCGEHQLEQVTTNGVLFTICQRCPYSVFADKTEVLFSGAVVLPYDHSLVQVQKEKI